ncbi:MAG: hypothetical protein AB1491_11070 [Thermodesulfobacteriota bacterium]
MSVRGMPAAMGGMMMMSSLLGAAMQGLMTAAINAQVRAQQQAHYQEMQQWLAEEQQRLAEMVSKQRAQRDAESKAGLDEIAKAMSDRWDSGKGSPDLASALSDPKVVDLRPQGTPFFGEGGDSSVVDLRDRARDTPQIPDGKKKPPAKVASKLVPQSKTAQKLEKMIQENQDPAKLDANLRKLEDKLAKSKDLSEKVKKGANFSPQDLQAWDRSLAQVAQEGMLRGLSLAMDFRGDLASGSQGLLDWYKEKKANPARMNQLLDALNNINEFAEFADHYHEFKPGELKDLIWNDANRNIMRNLDFVRTQHTINPDQYRTGKNMINESVALAEGREELDKIEVRVKIKGLSPFFWDRKKQLDQQAQRLAETTRGARRQVALKQPARARDDPELAKPPGHQEPAPKKPTRPLDDKELAKYLGPEESVPKKPAKPLDDPALSKYLAGEPPPREAKEEVDRLVRRDLKQRQETMDKIGQALQRYPAQTPPVTEYKTVLFMGTGNSQEDADAYLRKHFRNPVTGEVYEQIYGFGKHGVSKDLPRAIADHLEAERDLLSPATLEKCARLKGARINHLVAHSNGATIAEVLLKNNDIQVKELTLLGGDRTLTNMDNLERLAREKGIERINVYVNKGDIVPLLPQASQITGFGPLAVMDTLATRVTQPRGAASRIKVVFFDKGPYVYGAYLPTSGPEWKNLKNFTYHYVDNYHHNVRRYQATLK